MQNSQGYISVFYNILQPNFAVFLILKNMCQLSWLALLLFTSYPGNLSYSRKYARKIFLYCIFIKIGVNEQVYPYDGRGVLWIQNENMNFSTIKMAGVLILTRNAGRLTHIL